MNTTHETDTTQIKKDAFMERIDAEMQEWNAALDKLRARGRQAKADAALKIARRIEELEGRKERMARIMEEARVSSGAVFDRMRDEMKEHMQKLKSGVDEMLGGSEGKK